MNHYFINDATVPSNISSFDFMYQAQLLTFYTDNGVFSKEHIDPYSLLLVNAIVGDEPCGHVLDLGCGYGAIGILLAIATGGNIKLTQCDINDRALMLTTMNCKKNNVISDIILSDKYSKVDNTLYDIIVLNPPIHAGKQVYYEMITSSIKYLTDNGKFYLVISKKHGAKTVQKDLSDLYGNCDTLYKGNGVYVFKCVKLV